MRCNHIVIQLSPPQKIIIFVLLFFLSLAQSFVTAISSPELASCLAGDGSPGSSVSQTSWYLDLLFWTFPLLTPLFVLFYWLNLSSSPPSPLAPLAFSALCSLLSHHQSVPWSAPLSRERSPGLLLSPERGALLVCSSLQREVSWSKPSPRCSFVVYHNGFTTSSKTHLLGCNPFLTLHPKQRWRNILDWIIFILSCFFPPSYFKSMRKTIA